MFNIALTIGTFEKAQDLVRIAMKYSEDIDIKSGRFVIDAKSIMGVFSLDISKPVTFCVHTEDGNVTAKITNELHAAGII